MGQMDDEIQKAWERLDRAITLGWWDLDHLQNDSDLAVLRKMTPERWESLLERLPEMIDWRSWVQMERSFSRGRKRTLRLTSTISPTHSEKVCSKLPTSGRPSPSEHSSMTIWFSPRLHHCPRANNFVLSITAIENMTSL